MSSDKQEDSPDRQRAQITPYAERHGYDLVAEFIDEGVGGSDANLHRRGGYRRLCEAAKAKQFDLLLMDKLDRLSRADPIDWGATVKPLRDAGLRLETVARGPVNWRDPFGQMSAMFEQSGNKQYADTIAYNVLSKRYREAVKGIYTGPVPYGYRRGPDGKPVPDPVTSKVVEWLFRSYANGWTIPALIRELAARGVPSPRGRAMWSAQTVGAILDQRAYVGDFTFNCETRAQYRRIVDGEVRELHLCDPDAAPEVLVVPDNHPPLTDRTTWERVRLRRDRLPKRTCPVAGGGGWLLTGLAVCGHCGSRMHGMTKRGERLLLCGAYHQSAGLTCGRHTVPERELADFLARFVQREFLAPENLTALRAELAEQVEQERRDGPAEADRLRARLAKLEADIDRGARLVLECEDAAEAADLRRALAGMRSERAALEQQAKAAERGPDVGAIEDELRRCEAALWRLRESLESGEPTLVRAVFEELVSRIELHWTKRRVGTRKYHFDRGILYLRGDGPEATLVRHFSGTAGHLW
jgi:site-specific DNA recombinase